MGAFGMDRAVRGAYSPDQKIIFRSPWEPFRHRTNPEPGQETTQAILAELSQAPVRARMGKAYLLEIRLLSREPDAGIRNLGMLTLGRRLERAGYLSEALKIYSGLQSPDSPPDIRAEARRASEGMRGEGNLASSGEFLVTAFVRESLNPTSLAALGAGSLLYQWGRCRALGSLLNSGTASWLTRGTGARALSALAGMSLEVPAFTVLAGKGSPSELGASALLLGAMRLGGNYFGNAGAFAGLWIAKEGEARLAGSERRPFSRALVESLATFLQFQIGGRLAGALGGKALRQLAWQIDAANVGPRFPNLFGKLRAAPSLSFARREIPTANRLSRRPNLLLMEALPEAAGSLPGKRIQGQAVHSLENFPEIYRVILPQVRDLLVRDPRLVPLLQAHEAVLGKLNDTLERSDFPGAAPFAVRLLAEEILPHLNDELLLSEHPLARIASMSLAAHYQAIGDHVGAQVYRDLNAAYDRLGESGEAAMSDAEARVLKSLELDPFNPWLIRLGRQLSRRLGELANRPPEHYEKLGQAVEDLPRKWKEHPIARHIEDKFIDNFKKHFLQASWRNVGWAAFLGGLVPTLEYLTGLRLIRYVNRWLKAMKMAHDAPGELEATRRRTSFEIHLYYGDYRSAVLFSETGSQLPVVWDLLERQALEQRRVKRIELEDIPRLPGRAVTQSEASSELERKLSLAPLVSLEGIAGSAKTYLAAQLAHRARAQGNRPVFWYTFKVGKQPDLSRFSSHLAHFLGMQQAEDRGALLRQVQEAMSVEDKMAVLASALARVPALLFLDQFHVVWEDETASRYFRGFFQAKDSRAKIVTISEKSPRWLEEAGAQIFTRERLSFEEAAKIFDKISVRDKLSDPQLRDAYVWTKGRPMALSQFAVLLKSAEPERIGEILRQLEAINLTSEANKTRPKVLKYLFTAVYETLSAKQQRLLHFLSLFREPFSQAALSFFGPEGQAAGPFLLLPLQESFLLEEFQPGMFKIPDRFRDLAYLLGKDSPDLHHRAAEYWRAQAADTADYLEAAYHYARAGDRDRAVQMLAQRTAELLKKGYGERVEEVFTLLTGGKPLEGADRIVFWLERSELLRHQGKPEAAREDLRRALSQARRAEDGLAVARIRQKMGEIRRAEGKGQRAIAHFEESARLFQEGGVPVRWGEVQFALGLVYREMGQLSRAELHFRRALDVQSSLGDREALADTYFQLGTAEKEKGNIDAAAEFLLTAVNLFKEQGRPEASHAEIILRYLE